MIIKKIIFYAILFHANQNLFGSVPKQKPLLAIKEIPICQALAQAAQLFSGPFLLAAQKKINEKSKSGMTIQNNVLDAILKDLEAQKKSRQTKNLQENCKLATMQ